MSGATKILCAVDLSEPSRLAVTEAAGLARDLQGSLTLLHVASTPVSVSGDILAAAPMELFEATRGEAERKLEDWRADAAQRSGLPVQATVQSSRDPATEIVRFAKEGRFDLIVVATHARSGLKRLMLGSVAEHVVRQAHCNVLVVRRS